ncbi:hypothetical protein OTU49_016045 [Cherax quadricarinatus]
MKVIKVPIPTFPPTAMVYSVNKYSEENEKDEPVDAVSAAIMAAVLEERQRERAKRHCSTCSCGSPRSDTSENDTLQMEELNGNGNGTSNCIFHQEEELSRDIKSQFKVNVVDVGTQVLPSYIGETGKVQSTCIYCHSSKNMSSEKVSSLDRLSSKAMNVSQHSRSKSQPINQVTMQMDEDHNVIKASDPSYHNSVLKSPTAKSFTFGSQSGSAWDWAAEGHDSGTPSTPSSLISASLSYESETSNVTSPQDSPGRLSLIPPKSLIKSPKISNTDITRVLQGVDVSVNTSQMSRLTGETSVLVSAASPYHTTGTSSQRSSNTSSSHTPSVTPNSFPQSHLPRHHIGCSSPVSTTSSKTHDRANPYFSPSLASKIPFSARSPHQDVFTPSIHRSPPQCVSRGRRDLATDIVASSTTTASSTETSL